MTNEEKAAVLAEARANVARLEQRERDGFRSEEPALSTVTISSQSLQASVSHDPIKRRADWRDEPEPIERGLDTPPTPPFDIDQRIAAAVAAEREYIIDFLTETVAHALAESLDRERKEAKHELDDSVRSLKIEVAELSIVLSEVRASLADARRKTYDSAPTASLRSVN